MFYCLGSYTVNTLIILFCLFRFASNTALVLFKCSSAITTRQVCLWVKSWMVNLPNVVQFLVMSIILRDLTQECRINL